MCIYSLLCDVESCAEVLPLGKPKDAVLRLYDIMPPYTVARSCLCVDVT